MKTYLFIIAVLLSGVILSCNKNDATEELQFEFTGTILGYDFGLCPCCGGLILDIDGDDKNYRGYLPEDSNIEIKDTEIPVKLNFTINNECGGLTLITIEDIEIN